MRIITPVFCLIFFVFGVFAQKKDDVLAVADGQNYTSAKLSPEVEKAWTNYPKNISAARAELFFDTIAEALFQAEAKLQKTTVEKLLQTVKAKIPAPTAAQIKAVYDANRDALGEKTLEEVKPQIIAFLRREPEEKALENYAKTLRVKYKFASGKDVNAPDLKPTDVLATVSGKPFTAQMFEDENKVEIYELKANVYDAVRADLEETIFADLVSVEAKSRNIDSSELMAQEITNKMRDYSNEERFQLAEDLREKLFAKYNVSFLLDEPAPAVLNISVDDDPSKGSPNAPVTVVMFSDFQCPACAAVHPVLQKVLADYGDKIRFVVRDFPLVTIHQNAFSAAQAANAAYAQGKFFEYAEILYRNQDALDAISLKKYAADAGLNVKQFELDLQSGKFADEVRRDMSDGRNYGITSTPTIFVNGVKVRELSAKGFKRAIERALQK